MKKIECGLIAHACGIAEKFMKRERGGNRYWFEDVRRDTNGERKRSKDSIAGFGHLFRFAQRWCGLQADVRARLVTDLS